MTRTERIARARRLLHERYAAVNTATCKRCSTRFAPENGGRFCRPCDLLTAAERIADAK